MAKGRVGMRGVLKGTGMATYALRAYSTLASHPCYGADRTEDFKSVVSAVFPDVLRVGRLSNIKTQALLRAHSKDGSRTGAAA
jgi:hypothetical protein